MEPSASLREPKTALKPKIFVFIESSSPYYLNAIAIDERGEILASHSSSDEDWAKHDMGFTSDWQHDLYNARHPAGWNLVWVAWDSSYVPLVVQNYMVGLPAPEPLAKGSNL